MENNLPTESKINIFEKSEFKIEINNKIFVDKNRGFGIDEYKRMCDIKFLIEDLHKKEKPQDMVDREEYRRFKYSIL